MAVILHHRLTQGEIVVFVGSQDEWGDDVVVAHLGTDDVTSCLIVIFHLGGDIAWILQVGSILTLLQVVVVLRNSGMHPVAHLDVILLLALVHLILVGDRRWRIN